MHNLLASAYRVLTARMIQPHRSGLRRHALMKVAAFCTIWGNFNRTTLFRDITYRTSSYRLNIAIFSRNTKRSMKKSKLDLGERFVWYERSVVNNKALSKR